MKKLFAFMFFLLALPFAIFAQEPTVPPADWGDIFANPALWLGSFAGASLLTAFLAAFVNGFFKVVKGLHKQLIAWAVAIVILVLCDVFNLKICYTWDFPIWLALIHGFAAGLASNGVFDIPVLKAILTKIESLFKPKEEPAPTE